jgi:hypothetical protein
MTEQNGTTNGSQELRPVQTWEELEAELKPLTHHLARKYSWLYSGDEDSNQEMLLSAFQAYTRYKDKVESRQHLKNIVLKCLYGDVSLALQAHYAQKRVSDLVSMTPEEDEEEPVEASYTVGFDEDIYLQEAYEHLAEICSGLEKRVLMEILYGQEHYRQAIRLGHENAEKGQTERSVKPSQRAIAAALHVTPAAVNQALNGLTQKLRQFAEAH